MVPGDHTRNYTTLTDVTRRPTRLHTMGNQSGRRTKSFLRFNDMKGRVLDLGAIQLGFHSGK